MKGTSMTPNPLLKRLGYADTDRLVIIHTDDIGMCQASLTAFEHLWEFGTIASGAVMVPCPWFPAVAEMCRKNTEFDMGVHATLNSEWESYRWGPISSRDPATGMLDPDGYFHQWQPAVREQADPEAVAVEIEAQVKRALDAGIDVTHVDTHMGTVAHPKFAQAYVAPAFKHRVPVMIPRASAVGLDLMGADPQDAASMRQVLELLESQGLPLLDGILSMPLDQPDGQLETAKELLNQLPAGITHFILHPAVDTPELRAITPDWPSRVANYQTFMSLELKDFIKNEGIHLIGYRQIRNIMRS
jgi:hypothetical protein